MITFADTAEGLRAEQLSGFFEGWLSRPSPETHLRLLRGSDYCVLAIDSETSQVVGFITAISDGVLTAFIPLLEVLPAYQRKGIGSELVLRMLSRLSGLYAVDLACDTAPKPFYELLGMVPSTGMMVRRYALQNGAASSDR